MIIGYNKHIGVKPLEIKSLKMQINNGFASIAQKNQLTAMEVVFGDGNIRAGDTVYMKGDVVAAAWFKEPVVLDDQTICICPIDQIKFVKAGTGWNDPVGVG